MDRDAAGHSVGLLATTSSLGFVKAEQKQLKDALRTRVPAVCFPRLWLSRFCCVRSVSWAMQSIGVDVLLTLGL